VILSGCYGAYTLGVNNVANVTGVYVGSGLISPFIATLLGGVAIALGAIIYGRGVITTIRKRIVPLDEFSAFIAIFSEAITMHMFTQIGVPVSTSHATVGSLMGIGLVENHRTINKRMVRNIAIGWIATPFATGIISYLSVIC